MKKCRKHNWIKIKVHQSNELHKYRFGLEQMKATPNMPLELIMNPPLIDVGLNINICLYCKKINNKEINGIKE